MVIPTLSSERVTQACPREESLLSCGRRGQCKGLLSSLRNRILNTFMVWGNEPEEESRKIAGKAKKPMQSPFHSLSARGRLCVSASLRRRLRASASSGCCIILNTWKAPGNLGEATVLKLRVPPTHARALTLVRKHAHTHTLTALATGKVLCKLQEAACPEEGSPCSCTFGVFPSLVSGKGGCVFPSLELAQVWSSS